MRYQGGKSKIARPIAEVIHAVSGRQDKDMWSDSLCHSGGVQSQRTLVSLFCGSCAVEAKIAPYFDRLICNDAHPYLMAMWQALQRGWEPPDIVTEAEYQYIKDHKDEDPALAGFVGFGCTFGAKWFDGYARDKRGCVTRGGYARHSKASLLKVFSALYREKFSGDIDGRVFALESKRTTLADSVAMGDKVTFICGDYRDVEIPPGSVVYADPPYAGTTPYKGVGPFDSNMFWAHMRRLADEGHTVFVSECTAPDDVEIVWEKEYGGGMKNSGITASKIKRIERLYLVKPIPLNCCAKHNS